MAEGLVPDLPELSTGDTPHGQGLLPRAGPAQQTPALCVPGLGTGQLCHWGWGPGRREQAVGRGGVKAPPSGPKSEEEQTPPWTSHSSQGRAQGGGDL